MNRACLLVIAILFCGVAGCKIEISVPTGGTVRSQSDSYVCKSGETCTINVVDVFFDETFIAQAAPGYRFEGWRKSDGYLCGNSTKPCHLFTSIFEGNELLESILSSEEVSYLAPVFMNTATYSAVIGTKGGRIEFPNGVTFLVPEGAVSKYTRVKRRLLQKYIKCAKFLPTARV